MSDPAASPAAPPAARLARAGIVALAGLCVLWETLLAPIGAGWLALKALPLVLVAPGVLAGRRRPRQVAALLLPWYFAEALVRALAEDGRHAFVAATAAALALATFVALLAWFRRETAGSGPEKSGSEP